MRTTVNLPDELLLQAQARAALQGQSLEDLFAEGLTRLLQLPDPTPPSVPARNRASAGAWAKQFVGIAKLAPGEATGDARIAAYTYATRI